MERGLAKGAAWDPGALFALPGLLRVLVQVMLQVAGAGAIAGAIFMISYVSCLQHAINFLGVHAGATAVISHPWLSTFTIQTLVPGLRQAGASGRGSSLRSPYEHDFWMSLKDWQGPVHA